MRRALKIWTFDFSFEILLPSGKLFFDITNCFDHIFFCSIYWKEDGYYLSILPIAIDLQHVGLPPLVKNSFIGKRTTQSYRFVRDVLISHNYYNLISKSGGRFFLGLYQVFRIDFHSEFVFEISYKPWFSKTHK